jgi:hypothetical protein
MWIILTIVFRQSLEYLGDPLLTSKSTNTTYFIIHQTLYYQKQNEIFIIE